MLLDNTMSDNTARSGERKESLACPTKNRCASPVVRLKRTRGISPSLTRSLQPRAALPSVPLASRLVSIRQGIQVFTSVPIGTSGSKDSTACLPYEEGELVLLPKRQGHHELARLKRASSWC